MSVVTLTQAKLHLKVSSTAVDTVLQIYLDACENWIAEELGIGLTSVAVIGERVDGGMSILYLERGPVAVITTVTDKYDDSLVDPDEYLLVERGIAREVDQTMLWDGGLRRYEVDYKGGYTALPKGLVLVILQLVARAYKNRDLRTSEGQPTGDSISWNRIVETDIQRLMRVYYHGRYA